MRQISPGMRPWVEDSRPHNVGRAVPYATSAHPEVLSLIVYADNVSDLPKQSSVFKNIPDLLKVPFRNIHATGWSCSCRRFFGDLSSEDGKCFSFSSLQSHSSSVRSNGEHLWAWIFSSLATDSELDSGLDFDWTIMSLQSGLSVVPVTE